MAAIKYRIAGKTLKMYKTVLKRLLFLDHFVRDYEKALTQHLCCHASKQTNVLF